MNAPFGPGDAQNPAPRWRFGNAVFDEAGWTLTVAGQPVTLENKPMKLLQVLLQQAGQAVRKDALLDAVWPGVTVVEGSLTTAMNKLRRALGDQDGTIIATVPGVGYRLAVPATREGSAAAAHPAPAARPGLAKRLVLAGAAVLVLGGAAALALRPAPPPPVNRLEVYAAIRALDVPALQGLIARGWDPALPLDRDRNTAIDVMLETCEWQPGHDPQKLTMAVRMLLDAGVPLTARNVWGDTAYSIANARRYCGPDHPVTRQLKAMCTGTRPAIDPACLADYVHSANRQIVPGGE